MASAKGLAFHTEAFNLMARAKAVAVVAPPSPWTDIAEYESVRVIAVTHKLRTSNHQHLVQSGPGQTLMLSVRGGYTTFRILQNGLEIPIGNVASAIPKGVSLASKLQKTTGSRLTPKIPADRAADDEEADDGEG